MLANLWPEPADLRPGFHEKDRVENELCAPVCAGTNPLADAQRQIATTWLELYTRGVVAPAKGSRGPGEPDRRRELSLDFAR